MTTGSVPGAGLTAAELIRSSTAVDRSDSEFILMHLLGLKRHELHTASTKVPDPVAARFRSLTTRIASGEPPQYLVNSAPFLDFDLYVDERVLVPRPETEQLVARALERQPAPRVVIDYGTGSGCIAIAIARLCPQARVLAVDVSTAALAVAGRNTAAFGLRDRVRLESAATLADPVFAGYEHRVDLLISNPPYIPTARIPGLEPRVRDHEPMLALDGGPNGVSILAMLLQRGPTLLRSGGLMALEIDASQAPGLRRSLPGIEVEPDLSGRPRFAFHTEESTS
jgi:release factor glutamine methyltransferase